MKTVSRICSTLILVTLSMAFHQSTLAHDPTISKQAENSAQASEPLQLTERIRLGEPMFPPGNTEIGGNGQAIDNIEGSDDEMLKIHTHSHLSLFYKGKRIGIPPGIGVVKPYKVITTPYFIEEGSGYYWLHTHDESGIIHVESPDDRVYTLGNFFNIWGRPLTQENVAGLKGKVQAFVNGKIYTGDVRDIVLAPHALITLVVGEPAVQPPVYTFAEGL